MDPWPLALAGQHGGVLCLVVAVDLRGFLTLGAEGSPIAMQRDWGPQALTNLSRTLIIDRGLALRRG